MTREFELALLLEGVAEWLRDTAYDDKNLSECAACRRAETYVRAAVAELSQHFAPEGAGDGSRPN